MANRNLTIELLFSRSDIEAMSERVSVDFGRERARCDHLPELSFCSASS